ncbi:glycosyl hydrolase [Terrimonas sp.]|uniref:family 43 glycosylhydrolase n=1 Tax=Terrimonas sp. TaxID=1914338 RepID=UPI000D524074|nr:family 43 glycosylhydrolase [Terrimonas sp.]PVD49874.1 glycosyl hydrolase [Terrimonas sp.]
MKVSKALHTILLLISVILYREGSFAQQIRKAPAPLYRDPVYDGPADPVLIWNREEKNWWMLYTQRRANMEGADVAYCYGTSIGVAVSADNGHDWVYKGALSLDFEEGQNTFWAPDIVFDKGLYHMFVTYIKGMRNHWGGQARLVHYTSTNLWNWKRIGDLTLTSDKIIDPSLIKTPDGVWHMMYKDEHNNSDGNMFMAESKDLVQWKINNKPVFPGSRQEGPKLFYFKNFYWLLTDEWAGMRVYKSKDMKTWEKQGVILDRLSNRPDDTPSGAHGDVVVVNDKAYVFYFTHPGRKKHTASPLDSNGNVPYSMRRSSIQVAELKEENGRLTCDPGADFDFWLP